MKTKQGHRILANIRFLIIHFFKIYINNVSNNKKKTITITFVELSLCAWHFKDII